MFERRLWHERITHAWTRRPIVWLTGVRRSGKSVLCRSLPGVVYLDCELPRTRRRLDDPEAFLAEQVEQAEHASAHIVLDEIHRLANPAEILKIAADHFPRTRIVATGSSTLGASARFRDTLAGRKEEIWLTPMAWADMEAFGDTSLTHRLTRGGLPPFFVDRTVPDREFQEWLDAYWAKDVLELFRLERRHAFQRLFELLLAQSGGIFEATALATPLEVSRQTVMNYLAVLEATFVMHVVRPYAAAGAAEIVSAPRVYGFDTGFVTHFREWDHPRGEELGTLWEHLVLNELQAYVDRSRIHYWRTKHGNEVDFVVAAPASKPIAIECKWTATQFDPAGIQAFRRRYPKGRNLVIASDVREAYSRTFGGCAVRFIGLPALADASSCKMTVVYCAVPMTRPVSIVRIALVVLAGGWLALAASAQDAKNSYVEDPDPLVHAKLDQWQDLKLGLLMHWGTYSQWGIVESWSICAEDEDWCRRKGPYADDYDGYKRAYEALQTTFNPVKFEPERWAKAAKDAGMRYVVFTTKHHDGFSMFDTKQTDYRITSPKTPFSTNPKADVTKAIFNAFRAQGMMVGAYFSKPDWHSPDYWWPNFATPDRNPNYDIKKYPDRWARFTDFTHAQINELMSNYGKVDILWLDGGWVKTMTDAEIKAEINAPDFKFTHVQSQNIDMPRLVRESRAKQPGLVVVDRAVPGPYQNYLTPENRVPDRMLPYPWEVPLTMARSWSYVPNDTYKSSHQLIQTLVDVVAKGGNLLLNIGPGPDGAWHDAAYDRLAALGAWMKVNSESIYATRPIAPYFDGKLRFTRTKDGVVYAIYLPAVGETTMPSEIIVASIKPVAGATITLLGTGKAIPWEVSGAGFVAHIPAGTTPPNADAFVFKISAVRPQ